MTPWPASGIIGTSLLPTPLTSSPSPAAELHFLASAPRDTLQSSHIQRSRQNPKAETASMPSVTHPESPGRSTGKKRRRDEDAGDPMLLYGLQDVSNLMAASTKAEGLHGTSTPQFGSSQSLLATINNNERLIFHQANPNRGNPSSLFNVPRKIIPLPTNKRMRVFDENDEGLDKGLISPDAQVLHPSYQHFSHAHPDYSTPPMSPQIQPHATRPSATRTNSSALLSPCHICHRKPTRKSDLDSFADCTGCGERTCFVCIRECQGWLPASLAVSSNGNGQELELGTGEEQDLSASFTMHDVDDERGAPSPTRTKADTRRPQPPAAQGWSGSGHRSMICSRCCVERGSEGDVVCLGCLAGMEGA